jgi:hypothetical protein
MRDPCRLFGFVLGRLEERVFISLTPRTARAGEDLSQRERKSRKTRKCQPQKKLQ